ncbi:MAG: ion transporter, partial [bacterium]
AFDDSDPSGPKTPAQVFDDVLDALFTTDVALCFFTAYYDRKGLLVRDLRRIARAYLRAWFIPDFGGSFPFDKVVSLLANSASSNVGAMRILKLVRLLKLLRAAKVFKALGELSHRQGFGAVRRLL